MLASLKSGWDLSSLVLSLPMNLTAKRDSGHTLSSLYWPVHMATHRLTHLRGKKKLISYRGCAYRELLSVIRDN